MMDESKPLMMDESKPLSPAVTSAAPAAPRRIPRANFAAWLFIALGYFFCCVFPISKKPLLAVLFLIALYALSFSVLLRGRARFGLVQKLVLLSAALALIAPLLWANAGNTILCFLYALTAYAYLFYAASGNCLEAGLSTLVGADLIRALFVFPFSSFGRIFPALASHEKKGAGKLLLKILLGLLLAVIPTAAALALLSYDSGFRSIIDSLFRFRGEDLAVQITRLLFTLPVAMYLFGLYASSVLRASSRDAAAEKARANEERRHFVPLVTAAAAVIPPLLVYIIFFVSQWAYYTSAFTGVLPAKLSYAEYAREGFFQLCAVSAINFLAVICLSRYVRREGEAFRRVLCVILATFSLVLIATAVSKLLLYIDRYDLTPDRVYAAWFMGLLTVLFLIVLLAQFFPRIKALPLCMAVTVALYLLLALSGPNARIAHYNVERYLSGKTKSIDIELLNSLGDDAVPEMLRLEEYMAGYSSSERDAIRGDSPYHYPENSYPRLVLFLRQRAEEESKWYDCTLSRLMSEAALRKAEFLPDGVQEKNIIRLQVQLDLREDIGLLILDYGSTGLNGAQGVANADRSLINHGETLDFQLCRQIYDRSADYEDLSLKFTVISEYADPNFENVYPAEYTIPLETISLRASYGESYRIEISGDRESGYLARVCD